VVVVLCRISVLKIGDKVHLSGSIDLEKTDMYTLYIACYVIRMHRFSTAVTMCLFRDFRPESLSSPGVSPLLLRS